MEGKKGRGKKRGYRGGREMNKEEKDRKGSTAGGRENEKDKKI